MVAFERPTQVDPDFTGTYLGISGRRASSESAQLV